jgi:hypothetical protein
MISEFRRRRVPTTTRKEDSMNHIGPVRRGIRELMSIGAAAVLLTGCANTASTHTQSSHATLPVDSATTPATSAPAAGRPKGLPDLKAVNGNDPTAVSRAALIIMWTTDASIDRAGQHDAQLRALPLLTSGYATQIRAASPGPPPPDAWTRNGVRTQVQLRPGAENRPADTATAAYRQWLLTVTTADAKGRHQASPFHVIAYVALARAAGQPWRVSNVTTY